jgi:hypothetical protein
MIADNAQPVLAPPGSILVMDSRMWHGSLPRRIEGERVVCSYAVRTQATGPCFAGAWLAFRPSLTDRGVMTYR